MKYPICMRITKEEREKIKKIIIKWVPNAQVYLFGSRTDDNALGGDIDLLILDTEKVAFDKKLDIIVDLNIVVGEQKYDVVSFAFDEDSAFKNHILQHAILI